MFDVWAILHLTSNRSLKAQQIVTDLAQWHVHSPEVSDMIQAIDFQEQYQLSFWDAMILQSARQQRCTQLITENLSDGQFFGEVQVINPFFEQG